MIDAIKAPNITQQMPHILCVFYGRTAFDLHAQGMSKEEAEGAARRKCEEYPGIPVNMIFPPIPWDKYELFHPKK